MSYSTRRIKECEFCGTQNNEWNLFCFECGKQFPKSVKSKVTFGTKRIKTCIYCGTYNDESHLFCFQCGHQLPQFVREITTGAEYAGFWRRFGAHFIDSIVMGIVQVIFSIALIFLPYAYYYYFGSITNIVYTIGFWARKSQTPGKMALNTMIVTEDGSPLTTGRSFVRYFGYALCWFSPFWLGFFWIIWDKKKQGWHDKLANTYVVEI